MYRSKNHDRDNCDATPSCRSILSATYTLVKRPSSLGKFGDLESRQYISKLRGKLGKIVWYIPKTTHGVPALGSQEAGRVAVGVAPIRHVVEYLRVRVLERVLVSNGFESTPVKATHQDLVHEANSGLVRRKSVLVHQRQH